MSSPVQETGGSHCPFWPQVSIEVIEAQPVFPGVHVAHCPPMHCPGANTGMPQACPHIPQFEESVCVSTHVAPQAEAGALQTSAPLWQVPLGSMALPHEPQFFGSLWRSVQTPLHKVQVVVV